MDSAAFILAVDNICKEKNISQDVVFEGMELALTTAYKKNFNSQTNVRVDIDRVSGEIRVFSILKVVDTLEEDYDDDEDDEFFDDETEEGEVIELEEKTKEKKIIEEKILLEDAIKIDPNAKIGDILEQEVTPKDFGRVATSTAKQVLTQKIREAERESIINEFAGKEDELVVGLLSREDAQNYYVDLGRVHGLLPKSEIIPGETLKMGTSVKVYVTKIETAGKSPLILLSRSHYGFVKRLFELEIPELADGTILLYGVARDAGSRSKVAVYSENQRVDAVGSCIGEKGSRINNILKELGNEKIDIVAYDKDSVIFIKNALSPAKDISVFVTDEKNKQALAVADGENLSLAIGKKGQNVRLAARLTHFKIDVKTTEQLKEEGINLA